MGARAMKEDREIYWYLACVRRAQPRYNESWAARDTRATNMYRIFVEIKWVYLSVGPSAATTDAHVFSGNLSCIFWWSMRRNARSPRLAARASGGSGPRSRNRRQLLGCAQQTPRRVLIDKGNRTPFRCPKMVARGGSGEEPSAFSLSSFEGADLPFWGSDPLLRCSSASTQKF